MTYLGPKRRSAALSSAGGPRNPAPAEFPARADWKGIGQPGSLRRDASEQTNPPPPLPTLCLSTPEPHRSHSVTPLIADKRCHGEDTERLRGYGAVVAESVWEATWG